MVGNSFMNAIREPSFANRRRFLSTTLLSCLASSNGQISNRYSGADRCPQVAGSSSKSNKRLGIRLAYLGPAYTILNFAHSRQVHPSSGASIHKLKPSLFSAWCEGMREQNSHGAPMLQVAPRIEPRLCLLTAAGQSHRNCDRRQHSALSRIGRQFQLRGIADNEGSVPARGPEKAEFEDNVIPRRFVAVCARRFHRPASIPGWRNHR